jgi:hypothetical protein
MFRRTILDDEIPEKEHDVAAVIAFLAHIVISQPRNKSIAVRGIEDITGPADGFGLVESDPKRSFPRIRLPHRGTRAGPCKNTPLILQKVICRAMLSKLASKRQSTQLRLVGMASQSTSYRERGAICAWCAEQTISAEAAASLLYLQQLWLLVADVAEIIEGKNLRAPLNSENAANP